MARFCLDTNVFIQSKNGPYSFDIFPAFWNFLDRQFIEDEICSSLLVYDELAKGNDELADWVQGRRKYFLEPDEVVQEQLSHIGDYVNDHQQYSSSNRAAFLGCADPWVIALAKSSQLTVVTHEKLVPNNSKKVKIPNICNAFKVPYIDLYQMLRILNARF